MTYTLVARCQQTGRLGLATASDVISVGLHCDGAVRSNVGATLTQGFPHPRNNALALNLVAQGFASTHVLGQLRANDPDFENRQIAIVDREGATAAHTGTHIDASAGHRLGANYVAMGTRLAEKGSLAHLSDTFESNAKLELEERLLKALEAVRDACKNGAGCAQQSVRSVALIVFSNQDYSDIDLRVDLHDEPIAELRRLYDEYQLFAAYYLERAKNPRNALPQREFADMLNARKRMEAS